MARKERGMTMSCTGCIHERICNLWRSKERQDAACYVNDCKETLADIIGDDYDLDRLRELLDACKGLEPKEIEESKLLVATRKDPEKLARMAELVEADRDGRAIIPPVKIGDSVYHITTCKNFPQVLDGSMWGPDGGLGTATGYYCPCELAENCPFQLEEDGTFDCDKHKNTPSIYEDVATEIVINDMENFVRLDYSGCVDFEDFGKTAFLTHEAAEAALKGGEKK